MKAPRYATLTISLDTQRFRNIRPEAREAFLTYHLDRLLCGDPVAESELRHFGLNVKAREAVGAEILPGE